MILILHNIRSAHNVGSIFRTADAAGVLKIYLVGYTPRPTDRFGRVQSEIKKTSLGASETVPWEHVDDIFALMAGLKKKDACIVAIEQTHKAIPYDEFCIKKSTAFIFGNEVEGVPREIYEKADCVVAIPMRGKKESLNVSVAVGIVLFNTQSHQQPDHFRQ